MYFYLFQNGRQLGPYTIGQIREFVESGSASRKDWVWTEGWPSWLRIQRVACFELSTPQKAASPESVRKNWLLETLRQIAAEVFTWRTLCFLLERGVMCIPENFQDLPVTCDDCLVTSLDVHRQTAGYTEYNTYRTAMGDSVSVPGRSHSWTETRKVFRLDQRGYSREFVFNDPYFTIRKGDSIRLFFLGTTPVAFYNLTTAAENIRKSCKFNRPVSFWSPGTRLHDDGIKDLARCPDFAPRVMFPTFCLFELMSWIHPAYVVPVVTFSLIISVGLFCVAYELYKARYVACKQWVQAGLDRL